MAKEVNTADAVAIEEPAQKAAKPAATVKAYAGWNGTKIIWGLTLVVLGVLLLLESLGVVNLDFAALWRLWPLLIVLMGLSVLALRGWVALVISIIATVGIVGLAVLAMTGTLGSTGQYRSETFKVGQSSGEVQEAEVRIKAGAGSLGIASHDEATVATGTIDGNSVHLKQDVAVFGNVQRVELSTDRDTQWWQGGGRSDLSVRLTKKLPVALSIDAGATDLNADLTDVITRSVNIDSGASKVWLKLGEKQATSTVSISTGASSVELLVPQNSGVQLRLDGGLSSRQLPDDLVKGDNNTYQSPDYDKKERKIIIDIDMGVSSFRLVRY